MSSFLFLPFDDPDCELDHSFGHGDAL